MNQKDDRDTLRSGEPWRALVSVACIRDTRLSQGARLVYADLCGYVNGEDHTAFPGMSRIARDVGVSRRSVIRHILELEAAGYLTIERDYDPDTKVRGVNRYTVWSTPQNPVTGQTPVTHESLPGVTGDTRVATPASPGSVTGDTRGSDTGDTRGSDTGVTITIPPEPTQLNETSERKTSAPAPQIDPRTRQALARANRAHGRNAQPSSSLDPPRNGRRRRTTYDTHPVQKAWLAGFGLTAGNGGENDRFAAILAAEHPDDYVLGWILEVTACVTEGRVAPEHRAGHLIQQIEAGVPLPRRAQLWLALPESVWGELVACARAAHAHHAAPPLKGLSRMARNAWPAWSRAFTSGEHARDAARHYAPRWETLPARFVGAGLAVEVEEWLEARRRALAAKEKAVERQTV